MQQVIENNQAIKLKKGERQMFKCFVYKPFFSGLLGFGLFFSIILVVKFLSHTLGFQPNFNIDNYDIILAGLGFILAFLIKFIDNFKKTPN
jgi:hypothetical protein